jgi:hypothetical protein
MVNLSSQPLHGRSERVAFFISQKALFLWYYSLIPGLSETVICRRYLYKIRLPKTFNIMFMVFRSPYVYNVPASPAVHPKLARQRHHASYSLVNAIDIFFFSPTI